MPDQMRSSMISSSASERRVYVIVLVPIVSDQPISSVPKNSCSVSTNEPLPTMCLPALGVNAARRYGARAMRYVALAVLMVVLAAPAAAQTTPSFVIQSDAKVGAFAVKTDGSLAGAIRAFGQPKLRRTGESCTATWTQYGLMMNLYNLGGANACSPRFGRFSKAVAHGTRWRTDKGLRIGMPSTSIRRYYPRATFKRGLRFYWPSGWWLVTRRESFGGGGFYPGLLAETRRGKVVAFQVRYPAGGD
jgi:hypothetical protein